MTGFIFRTLTFGMLAALCLGAGEADDFPYDESADARSDLATARAEAAEQNKLLLINFGANWCTDCRVLARAMSDDPVAAAIAQDFVSVKIDIGDWDKNEDIAALYDNPISGGIPAMIVADADDRVLFTTKAGQLATARSFTADDFARFFSRLAEVARAE